MSEQKLAQIKLTSKGRLNLGCWSQPTLTEAGRFSKEGGGGRNKLGDIKGWKGNSGWLHASLILGL